MSINVDSTTASVFERGLVGIDVAATTQVAGALADKGFDVAVNKLSDGVSRAARAIATEAGDYLGKGVVGRAAAGGLSYAFGHAAGMTNDEALSQAHKAANPYANTVDAFEESNVTGEELKSVFLEDSFRTGMSAYGAVVGAVVGSAIPIPGVGTAAGAFVGGVAGEFVANVIIEGDQNSGLTQDPTLEVRDITKMLPHSGDGIPNEKLAHMADLKGQIHELEQEGGLLAKFKASNLERDLNNEAWEYFRDGGRAHTAEVDIAKGIQEQGISIVKEQIAEMETQMPEEVNGVPINEFLKDQGNLDAMVAANPEMDAEFYNSYVDNLYTLENLESIEVGDSYQGPVPVQQEVAAEQTQQMVARAPMAGPGGMG